jgi:hypothetical protein
MSRDLQRVDVIVVTLVAVFGLLFLAAIVARQFFGADPIAPLHMSWGRTTVGVIFAVLASLVILLNVWLVWVGPWLSRHEQGDSSDYAGPSGLPVIGSILVAVAGILLPSSAVLGVVLVVLYLLDPLGLPAVLLVVARDGVS